ncbi:MAG: DAK2 domain-containing protein [Pseudonocardiaceae bacterium]
MLQSLDGAAVHRWATKCCDVLAAHRDEINSLNVFPVPDRDTGSNLLATMRAGLAAVCREPDVAQNAPPGSTVAVLARGALMGARGNSGVILSQVLRGLAEPLLGGHPQDTPAWDGAALRAGLCNADELAAAAVPEPVSGTVLTVLHAAARAAAAVSSQELEQVATVATAAAAGALADTPHQLAALGTAGVVDAGGRGLILILEALLEVIAEHPGAQSRPNAAGIHVHPRPGLPPVREGKHTGHEYEVMYLLGNADGTKMDTVRAELAMLGDCVAVAGSGQGGGTAALWKVHVHCAAGAVGAAIEAGARAGRPYRVTVLRLAERSSADLLGYAGSADLLGDAGSADLPGGAGACTAPAPLATAHGVLAVVAGSGVAELFRGSGATTAPDTSSPADLLAALAATRASRVTVLADPNALDSAEYAVAAAQDTGQEVVLVPISSPVQALAAIAVHDPARCVAEDRTAMIEAASATRWGELIAVRPGQVLGLLGAEAILIERDALTAARELTDRMLSAGGELVTVLLGQDAPVGVAEGVTEHLRTAHPGVEFVVYAAGVPGRVLLLGVE